MFCKEAAPAWSCMHDQKVRSSHDREHQLDACRTPVLDAHANHKPALLSTRTMSMTPTLSPAPTD